MRRPHRNLPAIAFSASLVIHALLLIALPKAIEAAAANARPDRETDRVKDLMTMVLPEERTIEEEKPVEVELGIDAPTPPSPTWIGFAEPEPQQAEHATVEQAAFTDEPVAAAPPPPSPEAVQPIEEAMAVATAEPQPVIETPSPSQPQDQPQVTVQEAQPDELPGETSAGDNKIDNPDPEVEAINTEELERLAQTVREFVEKIQQTIETAVQAAAETSRDESRSAEQTPSPQAQPLSRQNPAEPQPRMAPEAQDSPRDAGNPADKESAPLSLIDVPPEQWQLGKPLARHGLQLKPRRPRFELLTLLTASPGNPICRISFGRDGVPLDAKLLRSCGDKRVDDAVLASLYRWRAEGDEVAKLAEGKSLDVELRIILNKRVAAAESQLSSAAKSKD